MRHPSLALAALSLLAGPASAAVTWAAAPTLSDMAAAYPAKAKAEGVGGAVELECHVGGGGTLNDCEVTSETPSGYGFGTAARALARTLKPAGLGRGAGVRTPMTFPAELARGETPNVKTPIWTALPSVADLQAATPKTEGGPNDMRVTLACEVAAGGALTGCTVDREEPAGQGFGAAILALAPKVRVDLMSGDGTPTVGAKVRLPIRIALTPVGPAPK